MSATGLAPDDDVDDDNDDDDDDDEDDDDALHTYPNTGSRTTPHRSYCPPGPQSLGLLPTRPISTGKITHQDQYLHGGELSGYAKH